MNTENDQNTVETGSEGASWLPKPVAKWRPLSTHAAERLDGLKAAAEVDEPGFLPDEPEVSHSNSYAEDAVYRIALVRTHSDGATSIRPIATIEKYDWPKVLREMKTLLEKYGQDTKYRMNQGTRGKQIEIVDINPDAYRRACAAVYTHGATPPEIGLQRGDIFPNQQTAAIKLGLNPNSLGPMFAQAKLKGRSVVTTRGVTIQAFRGD